MSSNRGGRPLVRGRTAWWGVLAVIWIAAALYQWHILDHGWLPHDEGTLAQSAERVLRGELPHRDFDEVWSGALTFLNAAAFRQFGVNLISLRYPLFVVFLFWIPALYYVATRFAAPLTGGAVTLLGIAWSLPQYSAAMPSWYNLFFATFAAAALLRGSETGRHRWLFAAGLAIGVSLTFKIAALFCLAAVLLYLVYHAASQAPLPCTPARSFRILVATGLIAFVGSLTWLIHRRLGVGEALHFVVPGAALSFCVYREVASSGARLGTFARTLAPFAAGVLIPVVIFLVPFARAGALAALSTDVFVAPTRRLDLAARSLPGVATNLAALPVALLIGILPLPRLPRPWTTVILSILGLALAVFLVLSRHPAWYTIRPLVPLTVLVGVWLLDRGRATIPAGRREQVFVVLAMAAMWSLVQFPFAWPPYFFYVAPLAAVAVLAVWQQQGRSFEAIAAAVVVGFLIVALVDTHPSRKPTQRLTLTRAGLLVGARDVARYDSLLTLLHAHASGGYTYAAPDCPEVYFLAGLANPTRTLWEFLSDSTGRTPRTLQALDDHHVTAIVINRALSFSGPLPGALRDSLAARYPRADSLDLFVVRWRP